MQNHITKSAARHAPEEILRALRSIDLRYDIHYLGDGRWAVGRVVPGVARRVIGAKMKANIERNPNMKGMNRRLCLAELAMEGFGVVQIYKFLGEPTTELVEDIRTREYLYQTAREQEFQRAMDAADTRQELPPDAQDEIEYRARNVAPQIFRGAKSFTSRSEGASNGEV